MSEKFAFPSLQESICDGNFSVTLLMGKTIAILLSSGFLLYAAIPAAQAQLSWEKTEIEQDLELGQEMAEATFSFQNKGRYPVTIRSTSTSCGCTAAAPTKSTFYPGEEGEIRSTFTVGSRVGSRRNTIQVFTDDPRMPQYSLVFAVEIPQVITISPRMVHWRAGIEEDLIRTVEVDLNPEAGIKLTGVEVDNELFEAVLEEDEPNQFIVKLTPRSTNSPGRAIITLQTEPELENDRHFSFYAYVR